jgi:two-component system sensor histidine kinase/response regulator
MSRRLLHFALVALSGTIIVAALLAVFYQRLTVENLTRMGTDQNSTLAQSLSNSLHGLIDPLLHPPADLDRDALRLRPEVDQFRALLREQVRHLSVVKIKLYTPDGLTVFSTDPEQIGEDQSTNPGIAAALAGRPVGNIVHHDSLDSFEGVIARRDLIESYLPVQSQGGRIAGVFEMYSDVTPLLTRIAAARRTITVGAFGGMALFYAVLVALFAHTDRALRREQAAHQRHLKHIEQANETLERRVAERTREAEQSGRFLQSVVDCVPLPVMVISKDFHINSMNKAARELFPTDRELSQPAYCYRETHQRETPCDGIAHPCTLQEVIKSGTSCKLVHTHVLRDGEPRTVELMAAPLRDSEGQITGIVEVVHDITERERIADALRRARDDAEAASRAKSEFVASMSHEIRTPMNAVIGMTDLLLLTRLTRKQQDYIRTIQNSGDMLLSVVDNILDFSKLEAGALAIEKSEFSILGLMEHVLEMMGYQAYSKGLEVAGRIASNTALRVSADRHRIRQILVNLLSNAIKFTEQGEVLLTITSDTASDTETQVRFVVQDSGVGIAEDAKTKLFVPFAQVYTPTSRHQGGSGLGLTICKRLVETMGGTIGFESQPGKGATFWFSLPLQTVASQGDVEQQPVTGLSGQRLLVVDDNPTIRDIVCEYATAWSMESNGVADADAALQRLEHAIQTSEPFAFAIIDVEMPDTDGLSLARRIRADRRFDALLVVLLTSIARPLDIGAVSALPGVQCINKPVLPSELRHSLIEAAGTNERRSADVAPAAMAAIQPSGEAVEPRILIAEDNPVSNRLLTDMLDSLGYRADSVADGPAALDAMARTAYDLILMDCQMPGMDGGRVTREIRAHHKGCEKQPLIIAVTANASTEHRVECLQAGMDDYLVKPVRLEELAARLHRWSFGQTPVATQAYEPSATSDPPLQPVVWEALKRTADRDGGAFLSDYIDMFLQDTAERLNRLSRALEISDRNTLSREAHAIKGACLELGIVQLGKYCDELRDAAKDSRLDQAAESLQQLRTEFDRLRPMLDAQKTAHSA